jgi:hypothetical protein
MAVVPHRRRLFQRALGRHEGCLARLATASGGRQGVHSLHVPRHGDEAPLTLDVLQPTQQELTEAHHRFDDPEHRFGCLFAQPLQLLASRRLQSMCHLLNRTRRLRRGFRSCGKPLLPAHIMRRAPHRDQRLDLGRHALLDVALTQIPKPLASRRRSSSRMNCLSALRPASTSPPPWCE